MSNIPKYKITFGHGGMAIDHEDAMGKFTFIFDVDSTRYTQELKLNAKAAKEKLFVERLPLKGMKIWECRTEADREHLALMLKRVKEHLCSLGYESEVVD
jgi:hypothetical protein